MPINQNDVIQLMTDQSGNLKILHMRTLVGIWRGKE